MPTAGVLERRQRISVHGDRASASARSGIWGTLRTTDRPCCASENAQLNVPGRTLEAPVPSPVHTSSTDGSATSGLPSMAVAGQIVMVGIVGTAVRARQVITLSLPTIRMREQLRRARRSRARVRLGPGATWLS